MPVYRRRAMRQIAKLNATSIDGYFGEGTPCFFIRGTILSDMQVDGEYRTLAIQRPGNLIEIEAFDGEWATIVVTTRAGNRDGDNLRARVVLRDSDLRSVGVDCEHILAGLGSFEQPFEEPAPAPEPVAVEPSPVVDVAPPVAMPVGFAPWTEATEAAHNGSNGSNGSSNGSNGSSNGVAHAHEPEPEPPAPVESTPVADEVVVKNIIEHVEASEKSRFGPLFGGKTSVIDGKVFIEVGASVVAIALPIVLFFIRSLFAKKDDR